MHKYWRLLALLSPLISHIAGHAETITPLKLSISESILVDNNLFRLPAGIDLQTLIGKPNASETIYVTTVGFGISKALSLQQLDLNMSLVDYKYANFDYLNTTSVNYNADLHWSVTPRLHGKLSASNSETANNFTNYRVPSQKNIQTRKQSLFAGIYDLNARVSLLTTLDQSSLTNDQQQIDLSDYTSNGKELGVRYAMPSGSSITYALKTADGQYLNTSNLSNTTFIQIDHAVRAHWEISSKSRAEISTAYILRTQPNYPMRDFSGINSNLQLSWDLTGKTTVEFSLRKDLYGYQSTTTGSPNDINYSTNSRLSIGPVWRITPKIVANLRLEMSKVDFMSATSVQRSDNLRDTSLSLKWLPTQRISATASLQRLSRSSNLALYNFNSTLASIAAQYSY